MLVAHALLIIEKGLLFAQVYFFNKNFPFQDQNNFCGSFPGSIFQAEEAFTEEPFKYSKIHEIYALTFKLSNIASKKRVGNKSFSYKISGNLFRTLQGEIT